MTGNKKPNSIIINDNIKINLDNIYRDLHKSTLYDKRIEEIKKFLFKKYDLDAFAMILLDDVGENMLYNFHNDPWAIYNWDSYNKGLKLNVFFSEVGLRTFETLFTISEGMDFIDYGSIMTPSREFLSAYIIGRKIIGYCGTFYNKINRYKVNFLFAFKKKTIMDIEYNTYKNFINDLKELIGGLDVFMIYYKKYKTINDSLELQQLIKEDELKNNFFKFL
jgi:hypothetical protein